MKRVISYGAGLDSFTMLLIAIMLGIEIDAVVFCDVSDGSPERDPVDPGEWPSTYRHIREVVIPLCKLHGIRFLWLDTTKYPVRDARSLFAWMKARKNIPIAGPGRTCTPTAKVERFERWARDVYGDGAELEVWIGYEAGEESRAATDPNQGKSGRKRPAGAIVRRNRFPLMEHGLCRCRCEALVRAMGFPVPRKSACVFCPYGSRGDWQTFARELPVWFAQTEQLEDDKPPTEKNGRKLSIMGYRTIYDPVAKKRGEKVVLRVVAPPLREFIKGKYRRQINICGVCGQHRATKATGCDYLEAA